MTNNWIAYAILKSKNMCLPSQFNQFMLIDYITNTGILKFVSIR